MNENASLKSVNWNVFVIPSLPSTCEQNIVRRLLWDPWSMIPSLIFEYYKAKTPKICNDTNACKQHSLTWFHENGPPLHSFFSELSLWASVRADNCLGRAERWRAFLVVCRKQCCIFNQSYFNDLILFYHKNLCVLRKLLVYSTQVIKICSDRLMPANQSRIRRWMMDNR